MTSPGEGRVNPVPFAYQAVQQGMSANAGLAWARTFGVAIRRARWLEMYGQARNAAANNAMEPARPLNRKPLSYEISTMQTKNARGWIQYVEVYTFDRIAGITSSRPFAVRSQTLQTRNKVIEKALSHFLEAIGPEGNYSNESILGAAYTATYLLDPLKE